jgi:hypothetical protein
MTHQRLPENNEKDLNECIELARQINAKNKEDGNHTVEEIDEKVIKNSVLYSQACITPMAAFFGGMLA